MVAGKPVVDGISVVGGIPLVDAVPVIASAEEVLHILSFVNFDSYSHLLVVLATLLLKQLQYHELQIVKTVIMIIIIIIF